MKAITSLAAAVALGIVSASAHAAAFKPSVVFDMGGKFDKSFNQAAYTGAEAFKKETGVSYGEFEITNEAQREQAMLRMAQRGFSPIVAVGFQQAPIVEKVAKQFPKTQFVIIDAVVDLPNVRSVVFKEHEGSFLVGALAVMKSESDKVGFVGGMDIPLIRKFACGYEQGAKFQSADADVVQNMTGSTPAAWNNPTKGAELAKSQFDKGVDVVYAAAGGTGVGVYQAAVDESKYAIGVDSNQNYLHPGVMLTSMVKRVDVAVQDAFNDAKAGEFTPGLQALGLKEGGVDWALDDYNKSLVTPEMEARVKQIRDDIIAGKIVVHDYFSTDSCEY
ncbi:BMP family ABC transporter substrate-binding protein [Enterovibrio norvegicus]|uniref:Basic membrane protein A n=2 Tax=Enterovibrio norvegicus TaxID=188144 RepID=A0A1I5M4Y8_9GAMM|nr:BMP family ABC transporter substrate-binding protein [Enterovibrio norvegicus]OEE49549.1 BMP family ABC transporter substrate-binding protein [Enterovibrio norvegicus]OEF50213.1 BMP family ABC transporter substrate-binding protein [Enterovibrio norvegicus]OEF55509.1 BMP family ABC transporter substrate-binding protein [Enterovibrio norvegicus]PMI31894.1 BMP family ABC transporter substrate-binding protein [Enterovibrio norvegicus]SFP04632.1 basic membrane protein A [Enterovibrio norvegicus 